MVKNSGPGCGKKTTSEYEPSAGLRKFSPVGKKSLPSFYPVRAAMEKITAYQPEESLQYLKKNPCLRE